MDSGHTDPPRTVVRRINGWVESGIETITQTSLGQALFKQFDRLLWVVEKSAQWSLPCQEFSNEENGKTFGKIELVRPLPWVLFLPALVILRLVRMGLNVGAYILNYPQIHPSGVVKCVQNIRRRLRNAKVNGMKNIRRKVVSGKDKHVSMHEAKKALINSIRLTLSSLSCLDSSKSSPSPPPTRIRITDIGLESTPPPDEKSATESAGSPMQECGKRKFSAVSSDEQDSSESESEPLEVMIDRLALDSSADPDFKLPENSSSSSDGSDVDQEVSLNELQDIYQDAKSLAQAATELLEPENVREEAPVDQSTVRLPQIGLSGGTASAFSELSPLNPVTITKEKRDVKPQAESSQDNSSKLQSNKGVFLSSSSLPEKDIQILQGFGITEFHSTNDSNPDADPMFYSPISSKSASPERWTAPISKNNKSCQQLWGETVKGSGFDDVTFSAGPTNSGATVPRETTNGVPYVRHNATSGKSHHKGKKSSHGNRRKNC